jgi:DNA-binding response OmpR family regulator
MTDAARVIVVDDEPDLRSMIAEYLGKQVLRSARPAGAENSMPIWPLISPTC